MRAEECKNPFFSLCEDPVPAVDGARQSINKQNRNLYLKGTRQDAMTGSQGKRTTPRMEVLALELLPRKLNALVPFGSLFGIHSLT